MKWRLVWLAALAWWQAGSTAAAVLGSGEARRAVSERTGGTTELRLGRIGNAAGSGILSDAAADLSCSQPLLRNQRAISGTLRRHMPFSSRMS